MLVERFVCVESMVGPLIQAVRLTDFEDDSRIVSKSEVRNSLQSVPTILAVIAHEWHGPGSFEVGTVSLLCVNLTIQQPYMSEKNNNKKLFSFFH